MTELNEVIVELSHNCNLSCNMCGFGKETNPFSTSKFMLFEKYKAILHQIGDKTKTIRLNGRGESTIHPDFIEILYYTRQSFPKLNINLFSNLSFNNKKILDALVCNQTQLFISMDSPEEKELSSIRKGAKFNFIEENIKGLKEISNRPIIIFTIQEVNIHRIYDIACYAFQYKCHILFNAIRRDKGIDTFVFSVNDNKQSIIDQFEKANKLYHASPLMCLYPDQLAGIELKTSKPIQTHGTMPSCPALDRELCILHDGTITPCNMFNPYVFGNIYTQSLNDIWDGEQRSSFLNSHKSHYYCKNCANLGM